MLDKILDRLRLVDVSSQADADKSPRRMSGPARARPGAALLARCLDLAPVRAAAGPAVWSPNASFGTSTNTAANMYYE